MNTAYNYKTGKNNITFNVGNSKKGTCKKFVAQKPARVSFADKCLTFIDIAIDLLCSARTLVIAKAFFAFIVLLGFLGIIGGVELGSISLTSGIVAISLIIALEHVILRD